MTSSSKSGFSRRAFLKSTSLVSAGVLAGNSWVPRMVAAAGGPQPLQQFDYGDVTLTSEIHEKQLEENHALLSSAMQAYLTLGSEKHLHAASNAFEMLSQPSFATGGWGPDETLCAPESADVADSLSKTHNAFETPCGSYAHFKLTRYLLRVSRESRYGDSMERVMYNTVLGAKPLQADGRTFYYSDYNFKGRKVYSNHGSPCCSGTLPQEHVSEKQYRVRT
jgi:hypothetical protein